MSAKRKKDDKLLQTGCACPYCDVELMMAELPFCQACKVTFLQCPECGLTILDRTAVNCTKCGAPLKRGR
jgi:hypothetical protein